MNITCFTIEVDGLADWLMFDSDGEFKEGAGNKPTPGCSCWMRNDVAVSSLGRLFASVKNWSDLLIHVPTVVGKYEPTHLMFTREADNRVDVHYILPGYESAVLDMSELLPPTKNPAITEAKRKVAAAQANLTDAVACLEKLEESND